MSEVVGRALDMDELQRRLRRAAPGATLVPRRILRRVINHLHDLSGMAWHIPHRRCYAIRGEVALRIMERDELGLAPGEPPPPFFLLMERLEPDDLAEFSDQELLRDYRRLLFHAMVHEAMDRRILEGGLTDREIRVRVRRVGRTVFEEARQVLRCEDLLIDHRNDRAVYVEFAATYLEQRYFARSLLPYYFPGVDDHRALEEVFRQDLDPDAIHRRTRLEGMPPDPPPPAESDAEHEGEGGWGAGAEFDAEGRRRGDGWSGRLRSLLEFQGPARGRARPLSPERRARRARRADRHRDNGNVVRAAIQRTRLERAGAPHATGPGGDGTGPEIVGGDELDHLITRLRDALDLDDASAQVWREVTETLLPKAAGGWFPPEAMLLYDLQKLCVDHERPLFQIGLTRWLFSLGRKPLKQRLPFHGDILTIRHLRDAIRHARAVDVPEPLRDLILGLLYERKEHVRERLRARMRPRLDEVLRGQGFEPANPPERVAFHQIVEYLLDQVIERGFLNFGNLRDAVSRSNLKLPDLESPLAFFGDDRLLSADKALGSALFGVYRPAEVYLRWLHRTSALGFGNRPGRFLTRYLLMPFGGAYLILAGLDHTVIHGIYWLIGDAPPEPDLIALAPDLDTDPVPDPIADLDADADAGADAGGEPGTDPADPPAEEGPESEPGPRAGVEPAAEGDAPPDARAAAPAADPAAGPDGDGHSESAAGDHDDSEDHGSEHSRHFQLTNAASVFGFGVFLFGVLHFPAFRAAVARGLRTVFQAVRGMIVDLPKWLLTNEYVRALMRSRVAAFVWRYMAKPLALTALIWPSLPNTWGRNATLGALATTYLLFCSFLNSRVGRDAQEIAADSVARAWVFLRSDVVFGVIRFFIDLFAQAMEAFEKVLYQVDLWLRFRFGQSRLTLALKAVGGAVWSVFQYMIRVIINLFVEPQFNPVKHFPVVTVSHKLILPLAWVLAEPLRQRGFEKEAAYTIALWVFAMIPGIFGFFAWELKENWKIYRANRRKSLAPAVIGSHGETMTRLLRPGFHSGTAPKLFARLRAAERAALEGGDRARSLKQRERLDHLREELEHFARREFLELFRQSPGLGLPEIRLGEVGVSCNRARFALEAPSLGPRPVRIAIAEIGGRLVADLADPGWLPECDPNARRAFVYALAGFYAMSGVSITKTQIRRLAGSGESVPYYAIQDDRLIARSSPDDPEPKSWPLRDSDLLFRSRPIPWDEWVAFWDAAAAGRPLPETDFRPWIEPIPAAREPGETSPPANANSNGYGAAAESQPGEPRRERT